MAEIVMNELENFIYDQLSNFAPPLPLHFQREIKTIKYLAHTHDISININQLIHKKLVSYYLNHNTTHPRNPSSENGLNQRQEQSQTTSLIRQFTPG